MKLASYQDGSRDGQLVVVSRDLASAHYASGVATRLQQVLDDWNFLSPQLETLSQSLNHGKARHAFAFEPARCLAPLPRAFLWVDRLDVSGDRDASPNGPDGPGRLRHGASDRFLASRAEIECIDGASIDVEAKLAAVVGDVAADVAPESALDGVRLLMLAADIADRGTGGRPATWPATAFTPVAVTPDELAPGWRGGRLHFDLELFRNGKRVGVVAAGSGMAANFGDLIAAAAARRGVATGSIVGSGLLRQDDPSRGFASIAGKRRHEPQGAGESTTSFMQPGDIVRIDMKGVGGQSLFGAIDLRGVGAGGPPPEPSSESSNPS